MHKRRGMVNADFSVAMIVVLTRTQEEVEDRVLPLRGLWAAAARQSRPGVADLDSLHRSLGKFMGKCTKRGVISDTYLTPSKKHIFRPIPIFRVIHCAVRLGRSISYQRS
jgi:hypothetical protein